MRMTRHCVRQALFFPFASTGNHSAELGLCLHHPHRFLNPDYSVSDRGRVAIGKDGVNGLAAETPAQAQFRAQPLSTITRAIRVGF